MDISLRCKCGSIQGVMRNASADSGNRIVCMCEDCQAFAHFLERASTVLDHHGGTDIFQVAPNRLRITQGLEHLRCVRLTGKGMCRWFAGCCMTPIANTAPGHKVPFAGIVHAFMILESPRDAIIGPVRAHIYASHAISAPPAGAHQKIPIGLLLRILGFLFRGWARSSHAPSPFFLAAGPPSVEPMILSSAERERLRALCGPAMRSR